MAAAFEMPALATMDVEPIANQVANLRRKSVRAVGGGEIGGERVGSATSRADLVDHGLRFIRVAAVMHDDAGAGGGKRQRSGTAHAARRTGNQGGLIGKIIHDGVLLWFGRSRSGIVFGPKHGAPLP